jgi:SAM-dependent methyltransferase
MCDYADLHGPHLALMRAALAAASPAGARVAVDLGCGTGGKTPWLAARCAPGAMVLGLDLDRPALATARGAAHAAETPLAYGGAWVAADALALPLRPRSVDLIWCVAALGLFADQGRALREAAAALAPGGALVVMSAGERWVRPRVWTPNTAMKRLGLSADGYRLSAMFTPTGPPPPPADGLGAEMGEALAAAGLGAVTLGAYLLDPPGLDPLAAMLPLADLAHPSAKPLADHLLCPKPLREEARRRGGEEAKRRGGEEARLSRYRILASRMALPKTSDPLALAVPLEIGEPEPRLVLLVATGRRPHEPPT